MTTRVQAIRNQLRTTKPSICVERARLVTEAFQHNFLSPPILQNAKAFEHILDHCTLLINDGELIVGNQAERFRGIPVFPEWSAKWIIDEIDMFETRPTDPVCVLKEDRKNFLIFLISGAGPPLKITAAQQRTKTFWTRNASVL